MHSELCCTTNHFITSGSRSFTWLRKKNFVFHVWKYFTSKATPTTLCGHTPCCSQESFTHLSVAYSGVSKASLRKHCVDSQLNRGDSTASLVVIQQLLHSLRVSKSTDLWRSRSSEPLKLEWRSSINWVKEIHSLQHICKCFVDQYQL